MLSFDMFLQLIEWPIFPRIDPVSLLKCATVETLYNDAGRTVRRIVITRVSLYLIFIR